MKRERRRSEAREKAFLALTPSLSHNGVAINVFANGRWSIRNTVAGEGAGKTGRHYYPMTRMGKKVSGSVRYLFVLFSGTTKEARAPSPSKLCCAKSRCHLAKTLSQHNFGGEGATFFSISVSSNPSKLDGHDASFGIKADLLAGKRKRGVNRELAILLGWAKWMHPR